MELRILHCADLHLDSPFQGLSSSLDLPRDVSDGLLRSTFDALAHMVDLAIERGVDAFTVAGDIFDAADHGLRPSFFFNEQLARLARAGIRSFVAAGNHDPLDQRRFRTALPQGAHLFDVDPQAIAVSFEGGRLATFYGASFRIAATMDNLARLVAARHTGGPGFHVAVLHANVGGIPGHDNYAPCTLDDLCASRMDAWLLGHVHERLTLHADAPLVLYPGNLQGRHVREKGRRGAVLLTLRTGLRPEVEHVPAGRVVFDTGGTDASGAQDETELLAKVCADWDLRLETEWADVALVVARWRLAGRTPLAGSLARGVREEVERTLRAMGLERHPPVLLETLTDDTRDEVDFEDLAERPGFAGTLLALAQEGRAPGAVKDALREKLNEVFLHARGRAHLAGLRESLSDEAAWKSLMERAERRALEALLGAAGR